MIQALRKTGLQFDRGLQDDELASTERSSRLTFPPDLRSLLRLGLPVSDGFPNWRRGPKAHILPPLARC